MAGVLWRSTDNLVTVGRFDGDVCPACGAMFKVLSKYSRQHIRTDSAGSRRFVVIDSEGWLAHLCDLSGLDPTVEPLLRLRGAETLHEIHEVVRTAARQLVAADGATFVLRSGDECVYVDEDAMSPLWRGQRFPVSDCISGWAMLNNKQAVIPDVAVDDRIPRAAYRPTFVKSLVMTPIGHGGDTFGAIGSYWARPHQASKRSLEALTALADEAADALARMFP